MAILCRQGQSFTTENENIAMWWCAPKYGGYWVCIWGGEQSKGAVYVEDRQMRRAPVQLVRQARSGTEGYVLLTIRRKASALTVQGLVGMLRS
jgi:hypothetical protein